MSYILVTGATGFLGGAVVANLIQRGLASSLLLLVRAANAGEGLERIRQQLQLFEVPASQLNGLTEGQILLGDFNDVIAFTGDRRLDDVTHVINCAAIASFANNPLIRPVNVVGTFAFAQRMAKSQKLKRFLHVGTAMACGTNHQSPIRESWDIAPEEEHLVPYTASKAEIEHKIRSELPELPFVVARPSIVVGHTRLGCKPSGSIFWVLRMVQMLGKFTCGLDEKVDIIPVDYCADALVKLALKEQLAHDLYHVSAGVGSSCTIEEIDIPMARARGVEPCSTHYQKVSQDEIMELADEFKERVGPCNRRLVLQALRLYGGFAELNYVFDNERLLAEGIAQPPRFTSYVGLCAKTSENISVQEQMKWDFK
ncbi:SDR family oxidoreductase [Candidatus Ferrigenium straubiae]|jgi:nucleoside-diphosphate-sugar epimerase|uniref:SDR family oxidoreductase n=1 Tax=Candidatus Ferrigenium straubiae TaxID=2919506 RepID=UPI003F4AAAA7